MSEAVTVTLVVNGRPVTRAAGAHLTLLRWLNPGQHPRITIGLG